jgi:hypothetical protein
MINPVPGAPIEIRTAGMRTERCTAGRCEAHACGRVGVGGNVRVNNDPRVRVIKLPPGVVGKELAVSNPPFTILMGTACLSNRISSDLLL